MNEVPVLNKKCPICGKNAVLEYAPFCSKRCADIDLNRWLSAGYVVHTNEVPTPEEYAQEVAHINDADK